MKIKHCVFFVSINFNICFGAQRTEEPSYWGGSFKCPQHKFSSRNKKNSIWIEIISTLFPVPNKSGFLSLVTHSKDPSDSKVLKKKKKGYIFSQYCTHFRLGKSLTKERHGTSRWVLLFFCYMYHVYMFFVCFFYLYRKETKRNNTIYLVIY